MKGEPRGPPQEALRLLRMFLAWQPILKCSGKKANILFNQVSSAQFMEKKMPIGIK